MKKYIITYTALLYSVLVLFRCATSPVTADGSGSDVGNGNVIGSIVNNDGTYASSTKVKLVPENYNPVLAGDLPDSLIDTTNSLGMYYFAISEPGVFNIEAVHMSQRTKLLIKGVSVESASDTEQVDLGTLRKPGAIRIFFHDTVDTNNGYMYIEGTTQAKKFSDPFKSEAGGYEITFDSLAEEDNSVVYYDVLNDPNAPTFLLDTVDILSGKIIERDAFLFWTNYTKGNSSLPGNSVNDIFIGQHDEIWFAVSGGVALLENTAGKQSGNVMDNWTVYTASEMGVESDIVLKIKYVETYKIWFATLGGFTAWYSSTWLPYTTDNSGIPTNLISDVDRDSIDNAWLSTYDSGLLMFDGTTWTVYDTANSNVPTNTVTTVLIDEGDTVWCATTNGVLKFKDSYFKVMNPSNSGLISKDIYCMAIDRNRTKWFGREGGVTRYNETDSIWTNYTSFHSAVFTDSVLTIVEDNDGKMWFGTSVGLTKFDGNVWHDYTGDRYPVLSNKGVRAIAYDSHGNMWIGTTNNGVIAFGSTIK